MMNALEVASTFRMDVGVMKGNSSHSGMLLPDTASKGMAFGLNSRWDIEPQAFDPSLHHLLNISSSMSEVCLLSDGSMSLMRWSTQSLMNFWVSSVISSGGASVISL